MNMCTLYNNLICIVPNSSDILHRNSKDGFIRARSVGALLCCVRPYRITRSGHFFFPFDTVWFIFHPWVCSDLETSFLGTGVILLLYTRKVKSTRVGIGNRYLTEWEKEKT